MKKLTIAGVAFFDLLAALIAYHIHDFSSGERKMLALLNGDANVDIVSFTTKYQQRRLQCTDTEVLAYLKDAMMRHPPQTTGGGGSTYEGCFKFKGGGTFEGRMAISTNGFDLFIGSYANSEGFPTHFVPLLSSIPEKVKQIFAFFDEPYQIAAGTVLILEPGKPPRREHDESVK